MTTPTQRIEQRQALLNALSEMEPLRQLKHTRTDVMAEALKALDGLDPSLSAHHPDDAPDETVTVADLLQALNEEPEFCWEDEAHVGDIIIEMIETLVNSLACSECGR